MTIEEAIKVIQNERECVHRQSGQGCDHKCATCDLVLQDKVIMNAYEMAIAALRAQLETEKNEPLTLNELREMEGKPVYAMCLTKPEMSCWGYVDGKYFRGYKIDYFMDNYGKVWLAYRHKPKEATT